MPYILLNDMEGNKILVKVTEAIAGEIERKEKCFVLMKDMDGYLHPVEVTPKIYDISEGERKLRERKRNESRNHLDERGLGDYGVLSQAVSEPLEEIWLRRELLREVYEVLETCTAAQRCRFWLHRICGYSITEIAQRESCGVGHIKKSIVQVDKKLKKYFD